MMRSPVRRDSAMPVSIGLGEPMLGNSAGRRHRGSRCKWKRPVRVGDARASGRDPSAAFPLRDAWCRAVGGSEGVDRLAGARTGGDLHHGGVHGRPQVVVALRRRQRDRWPAARRTRRCAGRGPRGSDAPPKLVGIRRLHLAEAADREGHMRVGGAAQLVEEIDVRNLPEQLVLAADRVGAAAGRDLQMEAPMRSPFARVARPFTNSAAVCSSLVVADRPGIAARGTRNTRFGAQMRDQVLAHERQRREAAAVERGERDPGASRWCRAQ